ncbi:MAG: hypothetical protein ACI9TH_001500 [Kiritimatiellia bacterium]|jgi:hypothetical protein
MKKQSILIFVMSLLMLSAQADPPRPTYYRHLWLKNIPLKEGERISEIYFAIGQGEVHSVTVPRDWGMEVRIPDAYEGTIVYGEAGHGTTYLNALEDVGRILTLAFYDDDASEEGDTLENIIRKATVTLEHPDRLNGIETTIPLTCIGLSNPIRLSTDEPVTEEKKKK